VDRRIFCVPKLARVFERPAQKRVSRVFGQINQLLAVGAIHLRSIADVTSFLSKNMSASRAAEFHPVIHGNILCDKGSVARLGYEILKNAGSYDLEFASSEHPLGRPPFRMQAR
jgi:hypothetical protein